MCFRSAPSWFVNAPTAASPWCWNLRRRLAASSRWRSRTRSSTAARPSTSCRRPGPFRASQKWFRSIGREIWQRTSTTIRWEESRLKRLTKTSEGKRLLIYCECCNNVKVDSLPWMQTTERCLTFEWNFKLWYCSYNIQNLVA